MKYTFKSFFYYLELLFGKIFLDYREQLELQKVEFPSELKLLLKYLFFLLFLQESLNENIEECFLANKTISKKKVEENCEKGNRFRFLTFFQD